MSPRKPAADAGARERLLAAAIRLVSEGGLESLQARKLAAEAGVSTMALYTHFDGMGGLVEEIAREGFTRFARRLAEEPATDNPVADLFALGLAYRDYALAEPQLYRVMFGLSAPGSHGVPGRDLTASPDVIGLPEGRAAFAILIDAVTRVIEAGRARREDPAITAAHVWSSVHGYVLLEMAGYFGDHGVEDVLVPLAVKLAVGSGDTVEAATRSVRAALARRTEGGPG